MCFFYFIHEPFSSVRPIEWLRMGKLYTFSRQSQMSLSDGWGGNVEKAVLLQRADVKVWPCSETRYVTLWWIKSLKKSLAFLVDWSSHLEPAVWRTLSEKSQYIPRTKSWSRWRHWVNVGTGKKILLFLWLSVDWAVSQEAFKACSTFGRKNDCTICNQKEDIERFHLAMVATFWSFSLRTTIPSRVYTAWLQGVMLPYSGTAGTVLVLPHIPLIKKTCMDILSIPLLLFPAWTKNWGISHESKPNRKRKACPQV